MLRQVHVRERDHLWPQALIGFVDLYRVLKKNVSVYFTVSHCTKLALRHDICRKFFMICLSLKLTCLSLKALSYCIGVCGPCVCVWLRFSALFGLLPVALQVDS